MLLTQSFFGWTTIESASYAMGISMNSILFVAARATSLGVIGREASEIAVSPAQNLLNQPPVPEIPTVTLTFGATLANSSATASVIG